MADVPPITAQQVADAAAAAGLDAAGLAAGFALVKLFLDAGLSDPALARGFVGQATDSVRTQLAAAHNEAESLRARVAADTARLSTLAALGV